MMRTGLSTAGSVQQQFQLQELQRQLLEDEKAAPLLPWVDESGASAIDAEGEEEEKEE